MPVFDNIAKSLFVANQLPLDAKRYFHTLNQMRDLGTADYLAYQYYEWMTVRCVEDGNRYVWKEVDFNFTGGVLDSNFQYKDNVITDGIEYSNRYFNFVLDSPVNPTGMIAKPYVIFKNPLNQGDYLEENDVAMGFFSSTSFRTMRYKGGPVNAESSWAVMNSKNPLSYVD